MPSLCSLRGLRFNAFEEGAKLGGKPQAVGNSSVTDLLRELGGAKPKWHGSPDPWASEHGQETRATTNSRSPPLTSSRP